MSFATLQSKINYQFKDHSLLLKAMTHRSYAKLPEQIIESRVHNERLEFLGDAVLELVVTEYLFRQMSQDEGHLTALRASLVNSKSLCIAGISIGLEEEILISKGEKEEFGKARDSIVTDAVEALIGAIYLDSGMQSASDFIHRFILPRLPEIIDSKTYKDPKTKFQEFTQKFYKQTPRYKIINSIGLDHAKIFEAGVYLNRTLLATAKGKSKQEAETMAAKAALDLQNQEFQEKGLLED